MSQTPLPTLNLSKCASNRDWDIWAHFFKSVKSNMGTLVFSRNVRTKPLWTRWKQCANSQNPPKTCPVQTIFVRHSCAHCVLIIILISGYVFWSFDEGKLVIVQTNKGLEFLSQKRNWRWNTTKSWFPWNCGERGKGRAWTNNKFTSPSDYKQDFWKKSHFQMSTTSSM